MVGVVLVGGVAMWAWFVRVAWPALELQTFGLALLLGAGGSVTSFSSLTMAQAVVGQNTVSATGVRECWCKHNSLTPIIIK